MYITNFSKIDWIVNPQEIFFSAASTSWILTTGFWVDTNTVWDDNAIWNDGV